jgi:hypothetical protein
MSILVLLVFQTLSAVCVALGGRVKSGHDDEGWRTLILVHLQCGNKSLLRDFD